MSEEQNNEDQYDYSDPQPQPQQDIETKVELDFYDAQGFIRNNQLQKAMTAFDNLYKLCEENNLKTWKVKILNNLLQLHSKKGSIEDIKKTLHQITSLNQKEKLSDASIKSIISTFKTLQLKSYQQLSNTILQFLGNLDSSSTLKGYLFMLERAINQKTQQEAQKLFVKVEQSLSTLPVVPPQQLLTFYSLQVKYSQLAKIDITDKLRKMQFKLSILETEAYMNDSGLSIIKQSLASIYYHQQNYQVAAQYLNEAFQEYNRSGKSLSMKNILKINVLLSVLCQDPNVITNQKVNLIYNQNSSAFKSENDIFCLFSLIQSFDEANQQKFDTILKQVNLSFDKTSTYFDIENRLREKLKKKKLVSLLKAYKRVKLNYLEKRIGVSKQNLQRMLYQLIIDQQINACINYQKGYLEISRQKRDYLNTQLQNIQNISVRF